MEKGNRTSRKFPRERDDLERQVYDAMRANGWIIPQSDEGVLSAEAELANDDVRLPIDLADPVTVFSRGQKESAGSGAPLPLLGFLREHTGLRPNAIARAMEVSVAFLSALARYPRAVPRSWRLEIAARAERIWQIDPRQILSSLERPFEQAVAASRDTPYPAEAISCREILDRSGLSPEAREFWLKLATEDLRS